MIALFALLPSLANEPLAGLDETLFYQYTPEVDPYSEATKYYRPQLSQRRRGLDWWVAEDILLPIRSVEQTLVVKSNQGRVRAYGSTKNYLGGVSFEYASTTRGGWNGAIDLDMKMGSDLNIEGVFREDIRLDLSLSREFSNRHYLNLSLNAPLLTRGLQSDVTEEVVTLTGDNLYNSSWGFYNGEVRNSRISRYMIPELNLRYQLPITHHTLFVLDATAEAGRRSVSRLGWYDGYNPTPDYYRKMPSYTAQSDLNSEVEALWRSNDTDYTQIAWDKLIATNLLSTDGEAHYVVENQVELSTTADAAALFSSDVGGGVELIYGARVGYDSGRNFKELEDLLGGDHLTDMDLYIGDYYNLGTQMQNDLRNPNREVYEGDRFGYDYTSLSVGGAVILGLDYRSGSFSASLRGEFGEQYMSRVGHYEKERFSGDASYGSSSVVTMADNLMDLRLGYSPNGKHHLALRGVMRQTPMSHSDLFIQVQNANRVVDNPTSQKISSVSLSYRYEGDRLTLDVEGYLLMSSDEIQTWSYYDDLSYTYSNVVASGIDTRSVGLDIVGDFQISRRLKWEFALSMGDYSYVSAPEVKLYDDVSMTLFSESEASAVEGCKVGNAPQLLATSSLTFFVKYGLILSLDSSYGGGRYVAPSFVRRSDRTLSLISIPELRSEIITQERLDSVFDLAISVVKMIELRNGRRVSINFRINNLLGDSDRIEYGRESNRILTTSGDSQYLEPNSYFYGVSRSFYLSFGYRF